MMRTALFLALPLAYSAAGQEVKLLSESGPVLIDLRGAASLTTALPRFAGGMVLLEHRVGLDDVEHSAYYRDGKLAARFRITSQEPLKQLAAASRPCGTVRDMSP